MALVWLSMKKMGLSMEPRVEVEVEEREAVAEVGGALKAALA